MICSCRLGTGEALAQHSAQCFAAVLMESAGRRLDKTTPGHFSYSLKWLLLQLRRDPSNLMSNIPKWPPIGWCWFWNVGIRCSCSITLEQHLLQHPPQWKSNPDFGKPNTKPIGLLQIIIYCISWSHGMRFFPETESWKEKKSIMSGGSHHVKLIMISAINNALSRWR